MLDHLAGTFWTDFYNDDLFKNLLVARQIAEEQTTEDLRVLKNIGTRKTTPLCEKIGWYPLSVSRVSGKFAMQLPDGLVKVPVLVDRLTDPNHILLDGLDYTVESGCIRFKPDPFLYIDTPEEEITFWIRNAEFDTRLLADCWGSVLGIDLPSTEEARELLCTVYDAIIGGTSVFHIRKLVGLLNGQPVTNDYETVEKIDYDLRGHFVATNRRVYRPSNNANPTVTIGDKLSPGEPLFDGLMFITNTMPDSVPALTIPREAFNPLIRFDLSFPNREVPVTLDKEMFFEIEGDGDSVTQFWQLLDKKKIVALLQTPTVNPAQFVLRYVFPLAQLPVLRNTIIPDCFVGLDSYTLLKRLVPPQMVFFQMKVA